MKVLAVAVLLAACGRDTTKVLEAPPKGSNAEAAKPIAPTKQLATLTTALPVGWTATYDSLGAWSFTSPHATAHLAQMSAAVAPSPEDYLALLQTLDKDKTTKLLAKQMLPDGFALALEVTLTSDPGHGKRAEHVVRKLGTVWIDCECAEVPDDATRDQVIAVCTSAKL